MSKQTLYNFLGSYNKAYKAKFVNSKDFNLFINKLKNFYNQISLIEDANEELLKDKFKECVLDNYQAYANDNRADLSIKKDGKTQVICEFKKPTNKNEMLQIDNENVNKKALQEAIWYFYNQDSKEVSYQIKNVLITDTEHFFFFNPKHFCNPDLERICLNFQKGQLAYNDTKTLYEQIGTKISEKNIPFEYAVFNLGKYKEKILNNKLNDADLKQLQYFFKALHPDFLLREFTPKDSNELNSKFYNELLYILGLKEDGKGQKFISASGQKGTLRDCIEKDLDCHKFDDTINLIIIWLNRLLFLKLFESQLIAFNDNDKSFAFLNYERISDYSKLNKLFFNILGKPIAERENKKIPYLNSSLFERQQLEEQYGNISNLDNEITLPLCKGSILSKVKNYPKNPRLLKYLLDFLEAYSFSSNVSDESNNKEIINSSVLGLIFEKLNGYKDGSFFTPAYITEYMSEKAIDNTILKKFNSAFRDEKAPCNSIEELRNLLNYDRHIKERKDYYNKIIDSIKICDPAVGSGHFLVSVLNYLVAVKSELGLLDIANKIEVQNDSLVVYELDGETQFQYRRNNAESLRVQKAIFNEKRKVIENCLFGVDINPISVQICCLRLWIELLKNTYYIGNTDEMQILPNIDINIKCGNSLVSGYSVKVGHCAIEEVDGRTTEAKQIKEYKELVAQYKNIDSKVSKSELKKKIKLIKDKLFPPVQLNIFEKFVSQGVFKDSMEWMIEFPELLDINGVFQGFDIIIANPPYGILNKKQNQKVSIKVSNDFIDYLKNSIEYKSALSGMMNIYKFFILRSFKLLKGSGFFIQIFPLSFACDSSFMTLRKYIFDNYSIIDIEAFPERDSIARRVFEHAKVSVCILSALNTCNKEQSFYIRKNDNKFVDLTKDKTRLDLKTIKTLDENLTIPLASNFDLDLLLKIRKIAKPLNTIAHCYTGEIDISINAKYITDNSLDKELIKGAILDRYVKKKEMSQGEIQFLNSEKYLSEIKAEKAQHHLQERIVMQGLTGVNEKIRLKMTIIPSGIFCANSVNYLYFTDCNVNKKYILALLNSRLLNYIFKISSTNSNVNCYEVDSLPIILADETTQKDIAIIVDKLLLEKKNETNKELCCHLEEQINKKVYSIYNLTYQEVLTIDEDFPVSEEEYNNYNL